jgi:hypothetical protein
MASPRRILKARVPVEKPLTPCVCDDCECPFLVEVGSSTTTCPSCLVRMKPDAVFVECECGVVIANPSARDEEDGLDEDGEWHCPKCR